MSERQQLVNRYLMDLSTPLAVRYRIHFLMHETDPSAVQMLTDELRAYSANSHNTRLVSAASHPYAPNWAFEEDTEEPTRTDSGQVAPPSASQLGQNHYNGLRLVQALACFERDKRENPGEDRHLHYSERFLVNLALGHWEEALSLAYRIRDSEAVFLATVASGDFQAAHPQLPLASNRLASMKLSREGRDGFVSAWELAHLIIFVSLATETTLDARNRIEEVRNASRFDLDELLGFARPFAQRDFAQFCRGLPEMCKLFRLSYYTSDAAEKLRYEIQKNVVANTVRPFKSISLRKIGSDIGIRLSLVASSLIDLISERKVAGYVDLVDEKFYGTDENVEDIELQEDLERTIGLQEALKLGKWKEAYDTHRPPEDY
jgi:hypothetical protein